MKLTLWRILRKVAFRFEAERVHHFFVRILRILGDSPSGRFVLRRMAGVSEEVASMPTTVAGIRFRNPIGLAAGFDKTGELIESLPSLGFGFVEVGTVTPRPQAGNLRPRLFRDVERFSLFNRMGFNSPGASKVAENVTRARTSGALPADFRIGVNLGKNKETSADLAHEDYRMAVAPFEGLADYLVVNESSPNTPGLRDLQAVPALVRIVGAVRDEISKWKNPPPIFLKLAPELDGDELEELIREEAKIGIDGWVLSNTLGGYWHGGRGGWSGGALGILPRERLERVRARSRLPIFSVGGILQAREVQERLIRGADLVQVYTGWIYFGPGWIGHLLRTLRAAFPRIEELRKRR